MNYYNLSKTSCAQARAHYQSDKRPLVSISPDIGNYACLKNLKCNHYLTNKPIQRHAINKATDGKIFAQNELKSGNQSGDVIRSAGRSRALLYILRSADTTDLIRQLREDIAKSARQEIKSMADSTLSFEEYYNNIIPFLTSALAQLLHTGNCGEFANVVYSHLVETSSAQYQIYACSFNTEDHAFNLIYEAESGQIPLFDSVGDMAGNINEIKVSDAWGNIVCSLSDYINGNNPYGRAFSLQEIDINHKCKGINYPIFCKDAKNKIKHFSSTLLRQYSPEEADEIARDAINERDLPGLYTSFDENPETFTAPTIINLLAAYINKRNYILHKINPTQREEVFRILKSDPAYIKLYSACRKLI